MTKKEIDDIAQRVSNDVYKAVTFHIQEHEKRGYNAHHRAQNICEHAKKEVTQWLTMQHAEEETEEPPTFI